MKGRSGNPHGARQREALKTALRMALLAPAKGRNITKAQLIAEAITDRAMAGDVSAAAFIADRVDGGVAAAKR